MLDVGEDFVRDEHHRVECDVEGEVLGTVPDGAVGWEDHEVERCVIGDDGDFAEAVLGFREVGEEFAAGAHLFGPLGGVKPCGFGAVMG